ncbi:MAG: hypothetical protein ACOC16_00310 [Nanoarchaeota archaeon]
MILTKDNLLRYIKQEKAVIPSSVAQVFDTTTTIASAALSELAKEKLIKITYLKLSSTPYYYDPKQSSVLIELGEKHLSKNEKEIFHKLKEKQIVNDNSLTIQERLAIGNIKDFAYQLELTNNNKNFKFWVWYQRNLDDTKSQILEALNPKSNTQKNKNQQQINKSTTTQQQSNNNNNQNYNNNHNNNQSNQQTFNSNIKQELSNQSNQLNNNSNYNTSNNFNSTNNNQNNNNTYQNSKNQKELNIKMQKNQKENFIENFLKENYLTIESKQKDDKGIYYKTNLQLSKILIEIDCYFFYKKPNQNQIIKYYTSSQKPKIFFIENCPKGLFKFAKEIDNLIIINI